MDQKQSKNVLKELEQFYCSILLDEVREKVRKLRAYGIIDADIEAALPEEELLPELIITKDYKIVIGGNDPQEVEMEPLVKTIYLLFLSHPEGIVLKCLPDYQKEIKNIYLMLKPQGLSDRIERSIASVSNPMHNSINEKCTRIRKALSNVIPNRLLKYYSITGNRGEAKRITLPKDRIKLECKL